MQKRSGIQWALIAGIVLCAGMIWGEDTHVWTGARPLSNGLYNTNQDSTHLAANWVGAGTADNDTGHYVFDSANLLEPWRTRVRESRDNITRLSMLFVMDEPVFNDPTDGGDGWVSGFTLINNAFNLAGPVTVSSGQHTINNEMTLLANTQWTVADGARIEAARPISGDFGITKTGEGVLFLDGANTFTQGVTVNAGTVEFGNDNRFGASTGTVTLNGGGLSYTHTADRSSARPFLIGPAGGTVHVAESVGRYAFAAGGSLSGEGDLIKTGPGTFYNNTQDDRTDGNIIVEEGTFEFSFANRIRENSTVTLHDGTTLENSTGSEGTVDIKDRLIVLDGGSAMLKNTGVREVQVGDISGAGQLEVESTSTGFFNLAGENTFAGGMTVSAGQVLVTGDSSGATGDAAIKAGAVLGGDGTLGSNLHFEEGAKLRFDAALTVDEGKTVTFESFDMNDIIGIDSTAAVNTYTLIFGDVEFDGITDHVGLENAFDLGDGKSAYFQAGSLQLVVIPEPATMGLMLFVAGLALAFRRLRPNQ